MSLQGNLHGEPFVVGDRVRVTGGYDQEPRWLGGGNGYFGTLVDVSEDWAVVELDDELVLYAADGQPGWKHFGHGIVNPIGEFRTAHGRWLALRHGWVGFEWKEPTGRLQVCLCDELPGIRDLPTGAPGAWVESHAMMRHVDTDEGS